MSGTWDNPFGIPGLTISNVALAVGIPYYQAIIPSSFAINGVITIGKVKAGVGWKVSENPINSYIYGEIANLYLSDLLAWTGLNLNLGIVGIKDVKIYIVPLRPVTVGQLIMPPGINLIGNLALGPLYLNAVLNAKILPPFLKISVQEGSLPDLEKAIKDAGQNSSELSANHMQTLYAANDSKPLQLAWQLGDVAHTVVDTTKEVVTDVASAAVSVVKDVLGLFMKFQLKEFDVLLSPKQQSITVIVDIRDKEYSFDFSANLLGDGVKLIKTIADTIIDKVKTIL